tara:strand:- start:103 stop:282 length:180 start_codon:yes stop_codon:yes gene_type:complete
MDSLKSKLPSIQIQTNDYISKKIKTNKESDKKEKYLDNILTKEFTKNYFSKTKKLNKKN